MRVYIIWLIGVLVWNFGFPKALPIEDVAVAILLSFLSMGLKKILNNQSTTEMRSKYSDNRIWLLILNYLYQS